MLLLGISGGILLGFLLWRGPLAGADALAYWAGVRIWLAGGDPYHPGGVFLPYVYAPWLLPLFVPWALLPWSVAWFFWRGVNVLLLAWSVEWAYRRRPLATAVLFALMTVPLAVTLDTGNVTLLLALAVWAAQFTSAPVGGALFTVAVSTKWFPVVLFPFLPPRTRLWAVVGMAIAIILSIALWQETAVQLDRALFFPRPPRPDYALLAWAIVPWFWRHEHPLWWLEGKQLGAIARRGRVRLAGWRAAFRNGPAAGARAVVADVGRWARRALGLTQQEGGADATPGAAESRPAGSS